MAGYVEGRWIKKKKDPVTGKRERTSRYGKGSRYRVSGVPGVRGRSFETLECAKAWLRRSSADQERGEFVDPRDGSFLLADYVQCFWFPGMSGSIKTRQNQSRKVLLHVLPHLGQVPLRDVTAARLRAYIADLEKSCSPQYARAILGALSNIFETAIDDKRLIRNPMRAKSVRWPKADEGRREAWPPETARQMRDSISDRYRITVVLGVGCGLRQGEVFGLSPDDIDYEKGVIYVRRQVQAFCGRLYFTLPKGGKTRVADMPVSVARELREHSEKYPAVEVELPRGEPGKPTRKVLLLTTRFGNAVAVNTYNTYIWKPALARVGIIPPWPAGAKPW